MSTSMHAVPFAKILVPTATAHATGHGTCFKLLLCNILHVIYIKIGLQSAFELSNWLSCGIKTVKHINYVTSNCVCVCVCARV